MLKMNSQRQHAGDTIIEVLICLAIVGSALTISYSIARRSLFQIRDAQERSEMLTLAQTELEILKNTLANDTSHTFVNTVNATVADRAFCITTDNQLFTQVIDPSDTRCAVDASGNFYKDCGLPCASLVDIDSKYPYRIGITYHPTNTVTSQDVEEWYVYGGRLSAGGYGNTRDFSIVPIMYRAHP